jgi:GTPase
MCKEHLGVAHALKVPCFFVITKVDICPEHILKQSLAQLSALLKRPGVRKRPFLVNTVAVRSPSLSSSHAGPLSTRARCVACSAGHTCASVVRSALAATGHRPAHDVAVHTGHGRARVQDVIACARSIASEALAPIFLTSAVTGRGLPLLRLFLNIAPQRQPWAARQAEPTEFIIDETFSVPGVGTVIAGTVKRGVLNLATPVLLGPDIGDGSFGRVSIKSIHYKRLPVTEVVAGQTAALALKKARLGLACPIAAPQS